MPRRRLLAGRHPLRPRAPLPALHARDRRTAISVRRRGQRRLRGDEAEGGACPAPVTVGEYTLERDPIVEFGYLTVTVSMSTRPTLKIAFNDRTNKLTHDSVTVHLKSGKLT